LIEQVKSTIDKKKMEEKYEERAPDPMIEDRMIQDDEEDSEILLAIQESLQSFTQQRKYELQIERLRKEEEIRRIEMKKKEKELLENRKKKLGLVLARLRVMLSHSHDTQEIQIIQDIMNDIEWSFTHTYFLCGFTPTSYKCVKEKKKWIQSHLSETFQQLLREENILEK